MEKLAYAMSLLAFVYIIFLYLTTKMIIRDTFSKDKSSVSIEKYNNNTSQKRQIDN